MKISGKKLDLVVTFRRSMVKIETSLVGPLKYNQEKILQTCVNVLILLY